MKTVLCYGDSLTWGYDPESRARHALANRWPSALTQALGEGSMVAPPPLTIIPPIATAMARARCRPRCMPMPRLIW